MAAKGVPSILAGYFNTGTETSVGGFITIDGRQTELPYGVPSKRPLRSFTEEIKALSPEEKGVLVRGVCALTGDAVPAEYAEA